MTKNNKIWQTNSFQGRGSALGVAAEGGTIVFSPNLGSLGLMFEGFMKDIRFHIFPNIFKCSGQPFGNSGFMKDIRFHIFLTFSNVRANHSETRLIRPHLPLQPLLRRQRG